MMNHDESTDSKSSDSFVVQEEEEEEEEEEEVDSDDDDEYDAEKATGGGSAADDDNERDEIKELERLSRKENNLVLTGKVMMVFGLLITVAAIWTSYALLVREQQKSFEDAFGQFARSVRDAAQGQVEGIHLGLSTLAHSLTASAQAEAARTNKTSAWPFYTMYDWASTSHDVQIVSGMEVFAMMPIVTNDQKEEWIEYANSTYEAWVTDGHELIYGSLDNLNPVGYKPFISQPGQGGFVPEEDDLDEYWPLWMYFPPPRSYGAVNWNLASIPDYENGINAAVTLKVDTVVSQIRPFATAVAFTEEQHDALHSQLLASQSEYPHSFFFHPVHEELGNDESKVVAVAVAGTGWDFSLRFLLPEGVSGVLAVLQNNCNQTHTYYLTGPDAIYIGEGDQHKTKFDHLAQYVDLNIYTNPDFTSTPGHCQYYMNVYPSTEFESFYVTSLPLMFAIVVTATFAVVTIIFLSYDTMVRMRNQKIMKNAAVSNTLITSMFPGALRDKVLAKMEEENNNINNNNNNNIDNKKNAKMKGRNVVRGGGVFGAGEGTSASSSLPETQGILSEYYPATTILFADIAGFTAWSSVRQPTQVFELLGTIFHGFDEIAKKKGVFKMETVGDCYVAVVGVPKPIEDHAVIMASFAGELRKCFARITRKLEVSLGPGTGQLAIRAGIHSGPAIGGVMPGHRSRFQLFGDTMNTASRMESTGKPHLIQASKETAELLMQAGKLGWIEKRDDRVFAKGKGNLQTYWVNPSKAKGGTERTSDTEADLSVRESVDDLDYRMDRLVDFSVNALQELLKKIVVAHNNDGRGSSSPTTTISKAFSKPSKDGDSFLEQVKDTIDLPKFDQTSLSLPTSSVDLDDEVVSQLRDFVTRVRLLHKEGNHFNNFEHSGHAVMSVLKLLSNIVTPDSSSADSTEMEKHGNDKERLALLHPSTQFAILLSVMIKNAEHPGIPNSQVLVENPELASHYLNRCVNEQHSLATCWYLFMEPRYFKLRELVCNTDEELDRLLQIVVNCVVATDISDVEFSKRNTTPLDTTLSSVVPPETHPSTNNNDWSCSSSSNRKATAVIEQLVLASEFAYTMQHPEIFRAWNKRLFFQSYAAFKAGRVATTSGSDDPAEHWYQTQLDFFDSRIIPLAESLKECGMLKECGDEYLNYARENRMGWKDDGEEIVVELVEAFASSEQNKSG